MSRVTKVQLAKLLEISLPTLDRWIGDYPDFPILVRGKNGRPWQFESRTVTSFLAKRDRELKTAGQNIPAGLRPQDRLALARADNLQRRMSRESLRLVEAASVRQALNASLPLMRRDLGAAIRRILGDCGIPTPTIRAAEAGTEGAFDRCDETIREFLLSIVGPGEIPA